MRLSQLTLMARNVQKSFGSGARLQPVLRDITLGVSAGETVFLTGPSGSGKTTLLSVLGCILTPDQGSVQILGQELTHLDNRQRTAFRKKHLGFIFQSFNLFPTLSAVDNLRLV